MAVYIGVDGVARECAAIHARNAEVTACRVGVDGVTRDCLDWTANLSRFEVMPSTLCVCDTDDNDNQTNFIYKKEEALKYGSVTIQSNTISVLCSTQGKNIDLYLSLYAVLKDGHRVNLSSLRGISDAIKFQTSYTLRVRSANGWYALGFAGMSVRDGHFTDYDSGTVTLSWSGGSGSCYVGAGVGSGSGYQQTTLTPISAEINGKTYTVQAIDNWDGVA